jgi:hypothetical protein
MLPQKRREVCAVVDYQGHQLSIQGTGRDLPLWRFKDHTAGQRRYHVNVVSTTCTASLAAYTLAQVAAGLPCKQRLEGAVDVQGDKH